MQVHEDTCSHASSVRAMAEMKCKVTARVKEDGC